MNTFAVWPQDTPEGAAELLETFRPLIEQKAIRIGDAAIVSWPQGHRKPKIRGLGSIDGPGMLWSGFWGMLFGVIFLVPVGGLGFGATAGALAGGLHDFGIDEGFISDVRRGVIPGSSALVTLSDGAAADQMLAAAHPHVDPLRSELNPEQERRLRRALLEETSSEER